MTNHTDTEEARELFNYAVNDSQLYYSRITPIIDNLKKKIKKGAYDKIHALKLWRYAADDAARRYNEEYITGKISGYGISGKPLRAGFGIFTVPIRNEVATLLQEHYDEKLHYESRATKERIENMYGKNPIPRSGTARKAYINKKSQITKKAPSERLKKRRGKNTEMGYFPNPIADKIALHFNAGNDANGNPRRVFVVVNTAGKVVEAINEGYRGERSVTEEYPGIAIVGSFPISATEYKKFLKEYGK